MVVNRIPFGVRGRKRRLSLFVTNSEREMDLDEPATNEPIEPMEIDPEPEYDHFSGMEPMKVHNINSNDATLQSTTNG